MSNTTGMNIQEKMTMMELSAKFELSPIEKDGEKKFQVTPKDETANLIGYVSDGGYEMYPTTTEQPINILALNDLNRFCKLMVK